MRRSLVTVSVYTVCMKTPLIKGCLCPNETGALIDTLCPAMKDDYDKLMEEADAEECDYYPRAHHADGDGGQGETG